MPIPPALRWIHSSPVGGLFASTGVEETMRGFAPPFANVGSDRLTRNQWHPMPRG